MSWGGEATEETKLGCWRCMGECPWWEMALVSYLQSTGKVQLAPFEEGQFWGRKELPYLKNAFLEDGIETLGTGDVMRFKGGGGEIYARSGRGAGGMCRRRGR